MALKIVVPLIFVLVLILNPKDGNAHNNIDSLFIKMNYRYDNQLDSTQIIIKRFFDRQWKWEVIAFYQDKSGEWKGEMCVAKTKYINDSTYVQSTLYTLIPKSSWKNAINEYLALNFNNLPDMKEACNAKIRDGVINIFIYRNYEGSRSVEYHSPELVKKCVEADLAVRILKVHEKYFKKIKVNN